MLLVSFNQELARMQARLDEILKDSAIASVRPPLGAVSSPSVSIQAGASKGGLTPANTDVRPVGGGYSIDLRPTTRIGSTDSKLADDGKRGSPTAISSLFNSITGETKDGSKTTDNALSEPAVWEPPTQTDATNKRLSPVVEDRVLRAIFQKYVRFFRA